MAQGARIRVDPDAARHIREAAHKYGLVPITEAVADDARRLGAVDTGLMVSTIETRYPKPGVGQVWVGGGGRADYWRANEFGLQASAYPAQPFMRPAIYRRRSL